jgi:hypothetical protein
MGFRALGREKLCLLVRPVKATVFRAHIFWETLARSIIAFAVLLKLDHPQLAPVYAVLGALQKLQQLQMVVENQGQTSVGGRSGRI